MSSSSSSNDHVFCDDGEHLANIVNILKRSSYMILDCEGQTLGREGGCLSLIGCGVEGRIFLIDATSIPATALRPFFDILESPSPAKIMFDGRMDFSELYHGHNIHLKGVLDLQIADVTSRSMRGEGVDTQLQRLSTFLSVNEVLKSRGPKRAGYLQIHKLLGLAACLQDHGMDIPKADAMKHDSWLVRPLPPQLLDYAAQDIRMIQVLYDCFTENRYITPELSPQSQRYIELRIVGRPTPNLRHSLLPLCIVNTAAANTTLGRCNTCKRNLPTMCFSNGKGDCWVCRAAAKRQSWQDHRKKRGGKNTAPK